MWRPEPCHGAATLVEIGSSGQDFDLDLRFSARVGSGRRLVAAASAGVQPGVAGHA